MRRAVFHVGGNPMRPKILCLMPTAAIAVAMAVATPALAQEADASPPQDQEQSAAPVGTQPGGDDADTPSIVESPVATECELHVWPAERFSAQTTGWLSGFGIVGALADTSGHAKGDQSRRTQMASALDSAGQIAALRDLDLPQLLAGQPANIVFHSVALPRKTIGKIKTRRAESQSPCYSELIILDVSYLKQAIYGRSLHTVIWYRVFGASQGDAWTYRGQGGNGLKLFPPKEGEDVEPAIDELVSVFKANFLEYARNAASAAKSRSRK